VTKPNCRVSLQAKAAALRSSVHSAHSTVHELKPFCLQFHDDEAKRVLPELVLPKGRGPSLQILHLDSFRVADPELEQSRITVQIHICFPRACNGRLPLTFQFPQGEYVKRNRVPAKT
jgi:hypothetical protein